MSYRELDNLQTDEQLEAYRKRLEDRFGPLPTSAVELMHVVKLRRLGRSLGCEKIILKQGRMSMHFVTNDNSPFYQSAAFGRVIDFAARHPRECQLAATNGKRAMRLFNVSSVAEAIRQLSLIEQPAGA